jgi:hypothetical protein
MLSAIPLNLFQILLWAGVFSQYARAAEPFKLSNVKLVKTGVTGTHGRAKEYPNLIQGDYPPLHTTIIANQRNILRNKNRALVVIYGGTGGDFDAYSLADSEAELADEILRMKLDPKKQALGNLDVIGFENPLYWQSRTIGHDFEKRKEWLDRYGTLDAQLDWFFATLRLVEELIEKSGTPRSIFLIGRSMGSGLIGEAVHRYIIGEPRADPMGEVKRVLLTGMLGHTAPDIAKWDEIELKENDNDPLVQPLGKIIYGAMGHATPGARYRVARDFLGQVVGLVGGHDHYTDVLRQARYLKNLADNHPGLAVLAYGSDTKHNPTNFLSYINLDGEQIQADRMCRMRSIMDFFIRGTAVPGGEYRFESDKFFNKIVRGACATQLLFQTKPI